MQSAHDDQVPPRHRPVTKFLFIAVVARVDPTLIVPRIHGVTTSETHHENVHVRILILTIGHKAKEEMIWIR
jgi:hypothetical protein